MIVQLMKRAWQFCVAFSPASQRQLRLLRLREIVDQTLRDNPRIMGTVWSFYNGDLYKEFWCPHCSTYLRNDPPRCERCEQRIRWSVIPRQRRDRLQ
jgi:hypothetical protein